MADLNVSEAALRPTQGANNRAYYYVDGIPTKGSWVDLDDISNSDEVMAHLVALGITLPSYGGDLLVADVEGPLAWAFYSCHCDALALDDFIDCRDECDDHAAAAAFVEWFGYWDQNTFVESYQGRYDSEEAFAEQLIEDSGMLADMPGSLQCYFDYSRFSSDLFITDYYYADGGYVFNRNV